MNKKLQVTSAKAISAFGRETQIEKAIEESLELGLVLTHYLKGKATEAEVIDEVADINIIAEQMRQVFGAHKVEDRIDVKLNRLNGLINEHD